MSVSELNNPGALPPVPGCSHSPAHLPLLFFGDQRAGGHGPAAPVCDWYNARGSFLGTYSLQWSALLGGALALAVAQVVVAVLLWTPAAGRFAQISGRLFDG